MKLLLTSTLEQFGPKLPLIFGDDLQDMNVLYVPTAGYAEEGSNRWLLPELEAVRHQVKSFVEFDIKNKSQSELKTALDGVDILYVTGGNTYCLLDAMNKINFKTVLEKFFIRGGVYLGSSAGSIVMCPDIEYVGAIDDESKVDLKSYAGLDLVDFSFVPHLDGADFQDTIYSCIEDAQKLDCPVIALNDDQALWIEDGYIRIY